MTVVILLILVIAWAVALLPAWLRNRSESRAADSIQLFRQHLSTLQRATPAGRDATVAAQSARWAQPARATARAAARRRRRDVFFTLAAFTFLTMVMAVVLGGLAAVVAFLLSAALLVGYTALLVRLRRRCIERAKVSYLVVRRPEPEPVILLRRSASS